jgi:hypothetical protein
MDKFLEYLRRKEAELRRELEKLNYAREVYLASKVQLEVGQQTIAFPEPQATGPKKTIKQLIYDVLDEAHPRGLTALEILSTIKARWMPDLLRTTLSPQLSRLKDDKLIYNDGGKWKLVKQDAPPAATEGASE